MAVILHGRYSAIVADFDRQRRIAYEQAQWLTYAFHNPAKMPPFRPSVEDRTVADERQRLVDDARVRGWFISMSMGAH